MTTPEDRRFHLFYGGLLVAAFLVDPFFRALLGPAWRSPRLSIYPVAAALIWLAAWTRRRLDLEEKKRKALEIRLARLEAREKERSRREALQGPPEGGRPF